MITVSAIPARVAGALARLVARAIQTARQTHGLITVGSLETVGADACTRCCAVVGCTVSAAYWGGAAWPSPLCGIVAGAHSRRRAVTIDAAAGTHWLVAQRARVYGVVEAVAKTWQGTVALIAPGSTYWRRTLLAHSRVLPAGLAVAVARLDT